MNYYFSDAPAGAGKTESMIKIGYSKIDDGISCVFIQSSKKLLDATDQRIQTIDSVKGSKFRIHKFHEDCVDGSVISRIIDFIMKPDPEPHIILMTWAAYLLLPFNLQWKSNYCAFGDEPPQIHGLYSECAKLVHGNFTRCISTVPCGPKYSRIIVKDRTTLQNLSNDAGRDVFAKCIAQDVKKLLSGYYEFYVQESSYQKLLNGRGDVLAFHYIMNPSVMMGFREVTLLRAHITETMLFKYWSSSGVDFIRSEEINQYLRHVEEIPRCGVEIHYPFEDNYSKEIANKENNKYRKVLFKAAMEVIGDEKFLYKDNKNSNIWDDMRREKDINGLYFENKGNGILLPNDPAGLNDYQHEYHHFVNLAALNPPTSHFKFLEFKGLCSEDVRTDVYFHSLYQAAMRTSIRNPHYDGINKLVVPDRAAGEYLQSKIRGSTLHHYYIDMGDSILKGKPGRPKIHTTSADKHRAYRERQKSNKLLEGIDNIGKSKNMTNEIKIQEQLAENNEPQDILANKLIFKFRDENPLYNNKSIKSHLESQVVTTEESISKSVAIFKRFQGTIWCSVTSTRPERIIDDLSHDDFIQLLKEYHKQVIKNKADNKLICPSIFKEDTTRKGRGGKTDVHCSNGIWIDIDEGDMTPEIVAELLPRIRMAMFNTYSHTKAKPRFRVYIPTVRTMTSKEYSTILKMVQAYFVDSGYTIRKRDPNRPTVRASGFDDTKTNASDLFYLPCQAKARKDSFFFDYTHGRTVLDPTEWLSVYRPPMKKAKKPIDSCKTEEEAELIATPIIEKFRPDMRGRGTGDHGFSKCAQELYDFGIPTKTIKDLLLVEAENANSPIQRKKQVLRLTRLK